ncbi:MAG: hypothetical protein NBV60_05515 [Erythrobacter sp.]|nr:hypothetical protein [Erythrobacter sp.]
MNASYAPRQELQYGLLISRSFENLWLIRWQVLAYLLAVGLLGFAMPVFGNESTGLIGFLLYFAGQYWLFHALLKARGLLQTSRIRIFTFIGLAALLILPIILGLAVLLVPGLFLVARWIAAPAFIVARGQGAFAATDASADAVRGSTTRVAMAAVVLFLIMIAFSAVIEGIGKTLGSLDAFGTVDPFDLIEGHLLPLLLLGLSVAVYELAGRKDTMIEDVFG